MSDDTPTKRPRRKPAKPSTAAKAERIEEDVRAWYRRGQQALGLSGEGAKDVGQAMTRLSEEVATNPMTLRRARQFAEVYGTDEEVDALLKLRTPEGLPLRWSHVQELISIKTKADRVRMQKRAAKEGWTVRRLKAEVQRLLGGKRPEGGRKFALPEAAEERLGRLAEQSQTWLHLLDEVVFSDHSGRSDRIAEARSGDDRDELRDHLVKALAALDEVRKEAGEARKVLRGLRATIDTSGPEAAARPPGGGADEAGPRKKG